MTRLAPASAGVIGWPVAHSKSPLIHRFWLAKLGLDGDYGRFPVRPDSLVRAIAALPALGLAGVNVTIPHKQAVIPLLDRVDPAAARMGAVNTILVEDRALIGHNTDAAGFLEPLQAKLNERHLFRMARVLGSGGAARAVVHALADRGFTIVVIARDAAKASALLAEAGQDPAMVGSLQDFASATDFAWDDRSGVLDLFVNATSLGMTGNGPLDVHPSHIPPGAIVYDLVYAPLETGLLATARAAGHQVIDGLAMLIGQAAAAFTLFYGEVPPRDHDAELRALLSA